MSNLNLTKEEINRLRSFFFKLIPVSEDLSKEFYSGLFEKYPEVRPYFKPDMQSQQDKLVDTLATLLDTLDRTDEAVHILKSLGQRHISYGATPEIYDYVEVAFLELVSQYASAEEQKDLLDLWARMMRFVSLTMLQGAQP
ncbi:MAG: globin domain-containing protein [Armatimonadota bacterium]